MAVVHSGSCFRIACACYSDGAPRVPYSLRYFRSETLFERLKSGFVNIFRHEMRELGGPVGRRGKRRLPVDKAPIAIGDRSDPHRRNIIDERNWRFEETISQAAIMIRERDQLFAQKCAIPKREGPHRADLITQAICLDVARRNGRMPGPVCVEVAQEMPNTIRGRLDDCAVYDADARHDQPKRACRARKAARKTFWPICVTSSCSRPGAQSNSALHSAKHLLPSVTGVNFNVAT
jgi:hypothetical protein